VIHEGPRRNTKKESREKTQKAQKGKDNNKEGKKAGEVITSSRLLAFLVHFA
jgi:hypothetical protein